MLEVVAGLPLQVLVLAVLGALVVAALVVIPQQQPTELQALPTLAVAAAVAETLALV
jgi:hypothetical protein